MLYIHLLTVVSGFKEELNDKNYIDILKMGLCMYAQSHGLLNVFLQKSERQCKEMSLPGSFSCLICSTFT